MQWEIVMVALLLQFKSYLIIGALAITTLTVAWFGGVKLYKQHQYKKRSNNSEVLEQCLKEAKSQAELELCLLK